jgi:hypothetical protein
MEERKGGMRKKANLWWTISFINVSHSRDEGKYFQEKDALCPSSSIKCKLPFGSHCIVCIT